MHRARIWTGMHTGSKPFRHDLGFQNLRFAGLRESCIPRVRYLRGARFQGEWLGFFFSDSQCVIVSKAVGLGDAWSSYVITLLPVLRMTENTQKDDDAPGFYFFSQTVTTGKPRERKHQPKLPLLVLACCVTALSVAVWSTRTRP